jgi:uncharacterized membrane protein required for colicin V production
MPLNWVDLLTAIVLFVGILRGRKRGLSEELLDTLQWIAIVLAGALCYESLAQLLSHPSLVSPALLNLSAYILIALTIKLVVTFMKRRVGEKVVGSDLFGRFEYYLGMIAGTIRWGCMYLFFLSILHAPFYSREMLSDTDQKQEKNFGSIRFPTLGAIQHTFFKESATGWAAEHYLEPLLLKPRPTLMEDLHQNSIAARHEKVVNDIMIKK